MHCFAIILPNLQFLFPKFYYSIKSTDFPKLCSTSFSTFPTLNARRVWSFSSFQLQALIIQSSRDHLQNSRRYEWTKSFILPCKLNSIAPFHFLIHSDFIHKRCRTVLYIPAKIPNPNLLYLSFAASLSLYKASKAEIAAQDVQRVIEHPGQGSRPLSLIAHISVLLHFEIFSVDKSHSIFSIGTLLVSLVSGKLVLSRCFGSFPIRCSER